MTPPSRTRRRVRTLAGTAALTLISAGIAVLGSAQPAAATTLTTIHRSSWAYIDSRNPDTSYLNTAGGAPIGALRDADGKSHKYRSFFTFDVSRLLGTQVGQATLYTQETQAQDCTRRNVEVWRTGPIDTSTTWQTPPAEVERLLSGNVDGTGCPASYVEWDLTAAVQQAVAAGSPVLTLELRVPQANEGDTGLGRRFSNDLAMKVVYNTAPAVPAQLSVDGLGCATQQPYPWDGSASRQRLFAVVTDADHGQGVTAEFAIWPADHPDQRTVLPMRPPLTSSNVSEDVPPGLVTDGGVYGFAARAVDEDGASSAWSQSCYFQTDFTSPSNPPLVSSVDYPSDGQTYGGQGIPGSFTFSANGVPDVVSFTYGWDGAMTSHAPADQPGGSATVVLVPPRGGMEALSVASVDPSGRRSPTAIYTFDTRQTQPSVYTSDTVRVGKPFQVNFAPGDLPAGYAPVTSYTFTVDGGPAQTVPADADGRATAEVTGATWMILNVYSTSANGWVSTTVQRQFFADLTPGVTSDIYPEYGTGGGAGQTGTFTFTSNVPGSTEFVYSFDGGNTWLTVPVGDDGTASVTWTPETTGSYELDVYQEAPDSNQYWYFYMFSVDE